MVPLGYLVGVYQFLGWSHKTASQTERPCLNGRPRHAQSSTTQRDKVIYKEKQVPPSQETLSENVSLVSAQNWHGARKEHGTTFRGMELWLTSGQWHWSHSFVEEIKEAWNKDFLFSEQQVLVAGQNLSSKVPSVVLILARVEVGCVARSLCLDDPWMQSQLFQGGRGDLWLTSYESDAFFLLSVKVNWHNLHNPTPTLM